MPAPDKGRRLAGPRDMTTPFVRAREFLRQPGEQHDDLPLARPTIAVARQNFWLATSTNIGGAVAGALGLLSPVAAGLIHVVHTLGVLANSSRLMLDAAPRTHSALPPSTSTTTNP